MLAVATADGIDRAVAVVVEKLSGDKVAVLD
jgi:hypothetical protein